MVERRPASTCATTPATTQQSAVMADGMSDYEKMRLANIARNEAALAQLEIPKLAPSKKKSKKTTTKRGRRAPVTGGRRSSRIAAAPRRSMKDGAEQQDDDSDYEDQPAYAGGDDDSEDEVYERPRQRRRASQTQPPLDAQQTAPPPAGEQTPVVAVELAKTGRSKCRGCFEPISAGTPRVGMTAWIMGRQSMTWSHPQCCINRLIVAVEATGRGKCKLTGAPLPKGLPKIGVRSHTATSWVALPGCASVLAPVLRVVPDTEREGVRSLLGADGTPPSIEGYTDLQKDHAEAVHKVLRAACTDAASSGTTTKAESVTPPQSSQDSGGSTKLTGRVAWKFGGATCYGTMIPQRETDTHCYATTHKGNVKTLKKGSQYWWMLGDQ